MFYNLNNLLGILHMISEQDPKPESVAAVWKDFFPFT